MEKIKNVEKNLAASLIRSRSRVATTEAKETKAKGKRESVIVESSYAGKKARGQYKALGDLDEKKIESSDSSKFKVEATTPYLTLINYIKM